MNTYNIAHAAGVDVANRRMRLSRAACWSQAAYDAAVAEYLRLDPMKCELCGEPAGEGNAICPACKESR